jgi:hypothetical protein
MDRRDERIYEEAAALWRALHDGEAPGPADAAEILDLITGTLPAVTYERLCSPWLRSSTITWPRPEKSD